MHTFIGDRACVVAEIMGDLNSFQKNNPSITFLYSERIDFFLYDLPKFWDEKDYVLRKDLNCSNGVPIGISMKLVKSFENLYTRNSDLKSSVGKKCINNEHNIFYVSMPIGFRSREEQSKGLEGKKYLSNLIVSGMLKRLFIWCDFDLHESTCDDVTVDLDAFFQLINPKASYDGNTACSLELNQFRYMCFHVNLKFYMVKQEASQVEPYFDIVISVMFFFKQMNRIEGDVLEENIFTWHKIHDLPNNIEIQPENPQEVSQDDQKKDQIENESENTK